MQECIYASYHNSSFNSQNLDPNKVYPCPCIDYNSLIQNPIQHFCYSSRIWSSISHVLTPPFFLIFKMFKNSIFLNWLIYKHFFSTKIIQKKTKADFWLVFGFVSKLENTANTK